VCLYRFPCPSSSAHELQKVELVCAEESRLRLRVLVVDDEPLARTNLAILLRRDPEVQTITECGSGMEAVDEIRNSRRRDCAPDLVFLDVQMPECDGFDVLEMLGGDLAPAFVFVTAYDQYALRAFEAGALDYLLKPFDDARFERALRRAKEKIAQSKGAASTLDWLAVKNVGQVQFVKVSEIDWIEAADYYSCLHLGKKTLLVRRSMLDLERELDANLFCRIHRSAIVKLSRVRSLTLNETGEYDVLLDDGTTVRLSRRYRRQLQTRLGISGEQVS
jgi:two-component system, LytTR family, response regulator